MDIAQLLGLPYTTLAVLASGYIGYRLSYIGHDGPHTGVDTVFISLAFAALAKAVMLLHGGSPILASIPAFAVVFISAFIWRLVLNPFLQRSFRGTGLIDHDRGRSAWESMLMRADLKVPTRLIVYLKSGSRLMCDDLRRFQSAPLGPCLFGPDGSVALYVTDIRKQGEASWQSEAPFDPENLWFGYNFTQLPATEIERVVVTRPT